MLTARAKALGKLAKIRTGDTVKFGGGSFKVLSAERAGKLIRLRLQWPDGAESTLLGVSNARIGPTPRSRLNVGWRTFRRIARNFRSFSSGRRIRRDHVTGG